ncbi:MAG: protein kinase domain-containing protein [Planctomycetota bacterium]|jgi:serine/threonine protein kinase/Flp pilus assembly protein TadD
MSRAKLVFLAALRQPSAEARRAHAEQACGTDQELRERVLALLAAHDESPPEQEQSDLAGSTIGPYRLLQEIGDGGFGVVYVAEQTTPVKRRVALKLIKPGMDTREVVARFETERQALALMDHPNIARVFDCGETPGGRPFFVMELVQGIHIHDYCDRCQLTLRERLELFVRVCRAVQHAHQKGIIHRDLKPSNVLVAIQDGKPVPKVIDFGVAKATGPRLTEATYHTRFAQMIGTPQYMSPEQAEMSALDVDTRTDIYALGVLLYELLTGTTPFTSERMKDATFDELRRIIREEDPPTPSARLTELNGQGTEAAEARRTDPRTLVRMVHGDLDWIVMKALEKDRQRRYETASALAADVERHLRDEPVEARPPSAWYRARKLARRNRAGVTIAVLVIAFIALSAGAVGWIARDRGVREAALQREFGGAVEQASSALAAGRFDESRDAVRRAEELRAAVGASEAAARALRRCRNDLGMLDRLEQARLARAVWDDASLESSGADRAYREAFRWYGLDVLNLDPEDASAQVSRSAIRDGLVVSLDDWFTCGRTEIHRDRLRAVLDRTDPDPWRRRCREALRRGDTGILRKLSRRSNYLGIAFHAQGKYDEAIAAFLKSIELDPGSIGAYHELGRVLQDAGRLEEAVATFRASMKVDPGDPWPAYNLGHALRAQGKFEEALIAYDKVIELFPRSTGVWTYRGLAYAGLGKFEEAVAECRKSADLEPISSPKHANLAYALLCQGRLEAAVAACRKTFEVDPGNEAAYVTLGSALLAQGKFEKAVAACHEAIQLGATEAHEYRNPFHVSYLARDRLAEASVHSQLAWVFATVPIVELRDPARALELAKSSTQLGPQVGRNWLTLGVAQYRAGDDAAAIAALRKSMALRDCGNGYDWIFLAMAHARAGRNEEARDEYERAVAWLANHNPSNEELRRFRAEAATLLGIDTNDK